MVFPATGVSFVSSALRRSRKLQSKYRGQFLTAISQPWKSSVERTPPPRRRTASSNATEPPSIRTASYTATKRRRAFGKYDFQFTRKAAWKIFFVTGEGINVSGEGRELSGMTCFFFRSNRKAQTTLSGVYGRMLEGSVCAIKTGNWFLMEIKAPSRRGIKTTV